MARSLELELDLRLEAAAASELGEVMAETDHMRAPKVVWEAVSKRVLTLDWVDATPLSRPEALDLPGLDRPALANHLTRGFLSQALDHGVFHADLHEGNLFIAAPDVMQAVDFGIVGRLGANERRFLAEILWGFLRRDYRRVAEVHFEAGYVPAGQDVALFAQALRRWASPSSAVRRGRCRWAGCWASCSRSPACSACACAPNWCCCRRPWWRWRAWPAGSTRSTTSGPPPARWVSAGCAANSPPSADWKTWPRAG